MEKTEEKIEKRGIFVRIYNWFRNLSMKGFFGLLIMIFIIIIILSSISFLPSIIERASSSLSAALYSIFIPAEKATITADKKIVNSGEDFTITFKKVTDTTGFFTVSYSCDFNIDLMSVESNGLKKINCDTPYYLLENETAVQIRPITNDSVTRLVIDGSFENNDTQKIEKIGVARITIKNDSANTVTNSPVNISTTPTSAVTNTSTNIIENPITNAIAPIYYGKPDLAIRILQVGLLINGTNLITTQNQFNYADTVGIKFEIRNDGSINTGPWSFSVSLPSFSTPNYNSNTQISLRPSESIIYTLGFSNLTNQNTGLITINVDPANIINESTEINNTASYMITNINYHNNYYNNNGCYINGIFTYNCYIDGNGWNYNNDNLDVSCYADPSDPETGDRVRWYADVSGGDGDYTYDWTGTNNLNSSSKNPTKTYNTSGTKRATVTVTDDNDNETTDTCSVYVD